MGGCGSLTVCCKSFLFMGGCSLLTVSGKFFGLGMLWRSGLVVCGECWHVIGSGGYVLVGVFVVLWVVLCMVGLLCLVSYCPADGVVGIGTAGIVLVCLVMLSVVVLVIFL